MNQGAFFSQKLGEENIIFDTAKGYNSRSKHPANLMSDFSLLYSVLNQL